MPNLLKNGSQTIVEEGGPLEQKDPNDLMFATEVDVEDTVPKLSLSKFKNSSVSQMKPHTFERALDV